jgi:ribosomal protein L7/L12
MGEFNLEDLMAKLNQQSNMLAHMDTLLQQLNAKVMTLNNQVEQLKTATGNLMNSTASAALAEPKVTVEMTQAQYLKLLIPATGSTKYVTDGPKDSKYACPSLCGGPLTPSEEQYAATGYLNDKIQAIKSYKNRTGFDLKASKEAIELWMSFNQIVMQAATSAPWSGGVGLPPNEIKLASTGYVSDTIKAIKEYRQRTGSGLKTAKEAIEFWQTANNIMMIHDPKPSEPSNSDPSSSGHPF